VNGTGGGRHDAGATDSPATPDLGRLSVLHVSQSTQYGLERYLTDLATAEAQRGWSVAIATGLDEPLARSGADLGVTWWSWPARRSPGPSVAREVAKLARIVNAVDPDVVHLHSSKAGLVGRLAVRGRRPTIFSPHAWSFLHGGRALRRASLAWERFAARWVDTILCVSEAERARGVSSGIRAEFRVVPNAVDLHRFPPAGPREREDARCRLRLPPGPLAVCVGRLVQQKGQDRLAALWPEVRDRVSDASLALVGEGELSVPDTPGVTLVGHTHDVGNWLAAADVVVQPSRWEGMSLVVLEALATGRSVVATDVDGMREAIGDEPGAAGAVVARDDAEALVEAISRRLRDSPLREREEHAARTRALRFSREAWDNAIVAVTAEVANRRPARP
jgi:glycosyltransferase involved in cell wall biosynthesis